MGVIEEKGRKRARKRNIKEFLLLSVAAAGVIGLAIAAPNTLGALRKLGLTPGAHNSSNISRTRKQMVKNGLLYYDGLFIRLTENGRRKFEILQARKAIRKIPKRWDGRWRVLIFDIPEHKKAIRDKIRKEIQSFGFMLLQKSVWIYPYPCEDLIVLLKADLKIGKDVLYMIVDEIEMDSNIRQRFSLPQL